MFLCGAILKLLYSGRTMKTYCLLILVTISLVASQNEVFRQKPNMTIQQGNRFTENQPQGGGNQRKVQGSQNPLLRLLCHQTGVSPVPTGINFRGSPNFAGNNIGENPFAPALFTGRDHNNGPRSCFCLPRNQVCNPSGPITGGSTIINQFDNRLINKNPKNNCPEEQVQCCFGTIGVTSRPPTGPAPISGCGVSRSLFPGQAVGTQAEFGEYPWMAAIVSGASKFVSGGVLVSPTTVVTAAHKVTDTAPLRVRLGDFYLSVPNEVPQFPNEEISVAQVICHPQFNPKTLANNVAILKLAKPVQFNSHINSACIPEPSQRFTGSRCYLSGWGKNSQGQFQATLREVDLPVVDEYEYEERLGQTFKLDKQSFIYAGGEAGKDACSGDEGSPLVCKEGNGAWTAVGLVAWGIGCGEFEVPGVYVNLATFSNFIQQYL